MAGTGFRFEIAGPDLAPVRAFGEMPIEEQRNCAECRRRVSAWSEARPGHFWTSPRHRNEVELWTDEGELVTTFRIHDVDWFEESGGADQQRDPRVGADGVVRLGAGAPQETSRPRPSIASIHEDDHGLLWVSVRIFENFPMSSANGLHFLRRSQDDMGVISYTVMRARLEGR